MEITYIKKVSKETIQEAIECIINKCFPAMNIANALGGYETLVWKLIREHSAKQLLEEARKEGIDIKNLKGNVDQNPIQDSILKDYLTDEER